MNDILPNLEKAEAAFGAGKLNEDESFCREVLDVDQQCGYAWHLMSRMAFM